MKSKKKYKAFISYSHADQRWGRWLHRSLEGYRIPDRLVNAASKPDAARLTPIFRDREELASSPNLSERINEALEDSESLVVVCSPNAARSRWVNKEIETFKRLGRSNRIFCLIVDGEPGDVGGKLDCFAPALRKTFDDRGHEIVGVAEPVAADARKHADGKKLARLKLIAGLLDVGLNDLQQRELQRRNKRLVLVSVSSVVASILTITLATSAVLARNEATMRREQADSLISFMLGDLRKRLQPVGRLDVLDAVGDQAMQYFSSLDESDLSGDALLTRAIAMRQIGEVRIAQGLTDDGLEALNEAANLLENSSIDDEATRLFELGQINYWIADSHFNDLRMDEANFYIAKYLQLSRDLVRLEPDNPDYMLELLYAESNLGTLAFRENDLDAARTYFTNALAMGRDLANRDPDFSNDLDLAITISWLGAIEASAGNLGLANQWYKEELAIHRSRWAERSEPARKYRVARALWLLADTLEQAGDPGAAVTALDESVQLYRELIDYDPLNYEWHEELAWALMLLARDSYAARQLSADEARATLNLAATALARIDEQESAEVHRVSAAIDVERAQIELLEGFPAKAAELSSRAAELLQPLVSSGDRVRLLSLFAKAAYVAAEAELAMGNEMASKATAETALASLDTRDDDHIRLRVYAALLAYHAGSPLSKQLLSGVAASEYQGSSYIRGTEAEEWWESSLH